MSDIIFDTATKEDIAELARLRIAYMIDDFGVISGYERDCMEKQLPNYFERLHGRKKPWIILLGTASA